MQRGVKPRVLAKPSWEPALANPSQHLQRGTSQIPGEGRSISPDHLCPARPARVRSARPLSSQSTGCEIGAFRRMALPGQNLFFLSRSSSHFLADPHASLLYPVLLIPADTYSPHFPPRGLSSKTIRSPVTHNIFYVKKKKRISAKLKTYDCYMP